MTHWGECIALRPCENGPWPSSWDSVAGQVAPASLFKTAFKLVQHRVQGRAINLNDFKYQESVASVVRVFVNTHLLGDGARFGKVQRQHRALRRRLQPLAPPDCPSVRGRVPL